MSEWQETIAVDQLAIGTMQNIELSGKKILLVNADDNLYAVNHFCSHDDIALSLGCIKGQTIKCSLHGAIFDLVDGKVLADPAEEPLQTWPVKVVNHRIQVLI